MRSFIVILASIVVAACSSPSSRVGDAGEDTGADSRAEELIRGDEVGSPETLAPDLAEDVADLRFPPQDVTETAGPVCEEGQGCFLDPCSDGESCLSGWCVGHMGEDVCTVECQTECPPGWSCEQIPGTAPDVVWLCISDHANLCLPCAGSADCKGAAGADDACIDYGKEGSFCGGKCAWDDDCPWGFSCKDAVTVDGVTTKQCVADAGVCPCTKKAVDLGLSTPCESSNEWGTCSGKRFCTQDGLTECDAQVSSQEVCNGADDNCDGDVDEALFVEGKYVDLCDDGDDCTNDVCKGADGCEHVALDGDECKDGNPCTVADACQQGVCVGTSVDCDDGNPCTDDSCNDSGGCIFVNNEETCDDGNPCTVADRCAEAECAGIPVNCDCQADSDCAALEDGDECNGKLVCAALELPFLCEIDPKTIVTCPEPPPGPDQICQAASCNPANGSCSLVPDHEGLACDDGNPCTVGEHCVVGTCKEGSAPNCNDGNPCTEDSCDKTQGCVHEPNTLPCNDGNVCSTQDTCAQGTCVGGAALPCDDANPCTADTCDKATGCEHAFLDMGCDDGNACTSVDACVNGICKGSGAPDCDDLNPCTKDSCTPATGCMHQLNEGPCDDKDVCTIGDHCHLGGCISSGKLVCSDGNPCTADSCDPAVGCKFTPTAGACNDGNACTTLDACVNGTCQGSGPLDCDDSTPCTKDSCDPAKGCVHSPASGPCDDKNVCTTGDACDKGACAGGAPLTCDDGNACTDDSCNPATGCVFSANAAPCDDGNKCTDGDQCKSGWCLSGMPKGCNDGNACTDDSCSPATGCVFTNNSVGCNDSDPCTVTDTCSGGVCVGSGALSCNDGNKCTADSCVKNQGCVYQPITPCCGNGQKEAGEECDDGNAVDNDGCTNACKVPSVTRTVPGFSGVLGPDLSGQGWSQCAGTGSTGTMGKQWYPLCEGHAQIRFACSVDNNESAEYTSGAFSLAGKVLLDGQCDDWPGASNSIYGSDFILSVDQSDPNCGNYNVGYQMYMHFGTQWGCAGSTNTHGSGRMFAYVKD